jgi:hypothetical protein
MRIYGREDGEELNPNSVWEYINNGIKQSLSFIPKDEKKDPWSYSHQLLGDLQAAILTKKPYSMVRLGDGEGRILGYPSFYNDKQISTQVLTYQFGVKVIDELKSKYSDSPIFHGAIELKYGILDALSNADIVGVPSWLHFRKMDETNKNAMLAQACCFLCTKDYLDNQKTYYDHYIFRKFQQDGYFSQMLKGIDFLGVVSHTDKNSLLAEKFNIGKMEHYQIPGHQTFMKSEELHFPDYFKKLVHKISVPYEGALFFVAAGYLGKIYCNEIKKKGGIAIDIGAIFDAWTGIGRDNETKNVHLRL